MTQLIIIGVYLSLLLCLGLFSSRLFKGTSKDYMLASHSIGPFLLLMSIFGTTMTAFALVGSSGEAYKVGVGVYGMLASSSGIIHSLCFFLLGIKLWSWGHKHGYTTQIQFFRERLESDRIGLLMFPILVGLVIPYLLIGVMASGVVISSITEGAFDNYFAAYDYGIPPWLGSLVISIVVLIYVFFGGMRGTAWANTFQTIVFMILGVITFIVISNKLGGLEAASNAVLEKNPSKLMREVDPKDQKRYAEAYQRWTLVAQYNYARRVLKIPIFDNDEDNKENEKEEAYKAYKDSKKPLIPNWKTIAEAIYAKKNELYSLTNEQINKALLTQDDRIMPKPFPEKWTTDLMSHKALKEYPRTANAERERGYKIFEKKIGHPAQDLDPNDPSKGKKWTIKKAIGVYRATSWAPDAPHPMSKLVFLTYFFVPLSVGMFPHLFQHWLTARSAASFKLPVVAHPLFIMIVWVPCVLVGVWATSAVYEGANLFPPHFPANAVLAAMVKKMTSPVLAGFLTAGILAAIMSSLDSQFLCIGTMFTEDIVVHYGGRSRFSDKQVVLMARTFIILIVAVTYGCSLLEPRRVFTLGVWCFSGFSSLFPIIFAAVYWKKLTKAGVYAGVLVAMGSWLYLFKESKYALQSDYTFLGMMPVATMVAASSLAVIVVSLITKPPSKETLDRFYPENKIG